MKLLLYKLLLLSISTTGASILSFAQTNDYFNNNPYWQVNSICAVPYPCLQNETFNYYIDGDTVLNNLTYKKVMKQGSGYFSWMGNPPAGCSGTYSYIDTIPWCYVRSSAKQMFIWMPPDTSEQLLFDFDLSVGDTLPLSYTTWTTDIYVTAIDSFVTGSGYRKRFMLAGNTWSTHILEGVGSDKGLTEPISIPFECGYNLLCYGTNDTAWYPVQGPTCNLETDNFSIQQQPAINLFPNPANDQITIKLAEISPPMQISVYTTLGQVVYANTSTNTNPIIPVHQLENGVYLLHLSNTTTLFTRRIIIQH